MAGVTPTSRNHTLAVFGSGQLAQALAGDNDRERLASNMLFVDLHARSSYTD